MNQSKILSRDLESSCNIRFQDCDAFRHLNNARYIDYFLNARQDHLADAYGLLLIDAENRPNESWLVAKTQIAYVYPAALNEKVRIRTRLVNYNERAVVMEGLMLDQRGERLKALCWIEFSYVNLQTGRPVSHDESLMELFPQVIVENVYKEDGFNTRVADVRAEFRRLRGSEKLSASA